MTDLETEADDSLDKESHLKRIYVALTQTHIPVLEEASIIDYQDENEEIVSQPSELKNYLDFIEEKPCNETPFPGIDADTEPYLTRNHGFRILGNERRRRTLNYLHNENGKVDVSDIAELIASIEEDGFIDSSDRKAVYINLIQDHIPKMDDLDILEYNEDRKTVERGNYFEPVTNLILQEN